MGGFLKLQDCCVGGSEFGSFVLREVKDGLFAGTEVAACDEDYFSGEEGDVISWDERDTFLCHL